MNNPNPISAKRGSSAYVISALVAYILAIPLALGQTETYTILVDEYDTPLPSVWAFNCTGGDRGLINDQHISFQWDNDSAYTATVKRQPGNWTFGGMWYSLIRINDDNIPLDFQRIFGTYVRSEYQGTVFELEIVLDSADSPQSNHELLLRIEFKDRNGTLVHSQTFGDLISRTYPTTLRVPFNPPDVREVQQVVWLFDRARLGDSVSVGAVRLKARVPSMPTARQAFLWSYSWLMTNYDPVHHVVNDRSNSQGNDFENITATAKAAKLTYYSYRQGFTPLADTVDIVTGVAATLIQTVPSGPVGVNALWPHFTKDGGAVRAQNTEWASGDTAYAALDMIAALQMLGDPQSQIPSLVALLRNIDWTALLTPTGHISHGYDYNGNKLASSWRDFGMETIGVNWAYAGATGTVTDMNGPPSANGSGFIDNAHYPLVLSGSDYLHNNWDGYRADMAQLQLEWYGVHNFNQYLAGGGLFGLSAAESPDVPLPVYTAFGTGGSGLPEDGNGEVVVLHYSGMIADIRRDEAVVMWETLRDRSAPFLQNRISLSPLNNVESMRVDKTNGQLTVNHLKGSWNLALQAEGWAYVDPFVRDEIRRAVEGNPFLSRGYRMVRSRLLLGVPGAEQRPLSVSRVPPP